MRLKKQFFPDQSNHDNNTGLIGKGHYESLHLSVVEKETFRKIRSDSTLRLNEMLELNSHLKELVDEKNRELAEAKATNSKFISIIAHDLRSPFSSIIGVLEILKEKQSDQKNDYEEFVNIAYDSACNTLNLIDNLLEWAISQGKQGSFSPVKVNLQKLLADEIRDVSIAAEQKEILVKSSIPDDLNVYADLQMAKTVIRNLISNSIKYSFHGGEIAISASTDSGFAKISVTDNGIGMSTRTLNSLFKVKSFHSTYGTDNEKGTGLGLILCKGFVELNGGTIRIESEQGKGCTTIFTLPLCVL